MKYASIATVLAASAFALSACVTAPAPKNIVATAAATPELSTLSKLISDAGLTEELTAPGPYTVFAPTDDAFKAVPAATLAALVKDKAKLKTVLSYHVVSGKVTAADVKNGPAKTLQGTNVALAKSGPFVTVDDAVVTTADVAATNGEIHLIDRVLMPPK